MMSKKKKIIIGVLGGIFICAAGSNLAVNYVIDHQKIHEQLANAIEKQTGRKVNFDHLSIQIIPWPEIKASNIKLANMQKGKAAYLIQAQQFTAKINLWSLLKKNINIHSLQLSHVNLCLEENSDKEKNWQFSPKHEDKSKSDTNPSNVGSKWTINFKSINLDHVQTRYDNDYQNKHANFLLKTVNLEQLDNDKIRFEIQGQGHQADFSISGRVNHSEDLLQRKNENLSYPVKFQAVLTEYIQNQNVGNLHINGTIKDFNKFQTYSISARGTILNLQNLNLLFPHAKLPSVENITVNSVIEDHWVDTDKKTKPQFKVLQLNTGKIALQFPNYSFDIDKIQIQANQFNENINIQLNGSMNGVPFRWVGDVGTLNRFQQIILSNMQKEIPVHGNLSSDNYSAQIHGTIGGENPSLKVKVNALTLQKDDTNFGKFEIHDLFYDGTIILPFVLTPQTMKYFQSELFNNLKAEGNINGKKLYINGFKFNTASAYFNWKNNLLKINTAQLIGDQHHLNFDVAYNGNKPAPQIHLMIHPSVIPMEWIEQHYKLAEIYKGPVEVIGNISAFGTNYNQWIHSLMGHIGIAGLNGTLNADGLKHYVGKAADTLPLKKNISTQCLAVHMNIDKDLLYFDTFTIQTKKFALNGDGHYSIPSGTIDFHLVPDIMLGSFSASAPVRINGNLNNPTVNFDKNKDKIFTLSINTLKNLMEHTDYCSKALIKAREQ